MFSSLSVGQVSWKLLPQQVHGQAQIQDGEIDCATLVRRAARSQDLAKEKSGSIFTPAPSFYLVPSHPLSPPWRILLWPSWGQQSPPRFSQSHSWVAFFTVLSCNSLTWVCVFPVSWRGSRGATSVHPLCPQTQPRAQHKVSPLQIFTHPPMNQQGHVLRGNWSCDLGQWVPFPEWPGPRSGVSHKAAPTLGLDARAVLAVSGMKLMSQVDLVASLRLESHSLRFQGQVTLSRGTHKPCSTVLHP